MKNNKLIERRTLNVSDKIKQKLLLLKIKKSFKNMDEVINHLISESKL